MNVTGTIVDRRKRIDRREHVPNLLADELAEAIKHGSVETLYQPQYSAADNAIVGAEALIRWNHVERGTIKGDSLFAIAAQSGLTHDLSQLVHSSAMACAANWPDGLRLSVNVTAADLASRDFVANMQECLADSGLSPSMLTLEITEQALVFELEPSARKLQELVDLGVRVALDDFGAGFCNFKYLKVLPLHYLKLDRSMVEGITSDRRDLEVFRGIIAMARALDLRVIAEGIESDVQREYIAREGCANWQGFLGAKAMTAKEFAALVAS